LPKLVEYQKIHTFSAVDCENVLSKFIQVKRDENGKLDNKGKFADATKRGKVKYEKEGRFGIGVAAIKPSQDWNPLGVRMLGYAYSGKALISLDERDAKMREGITRGYLKGGAPWVVSNREEVQLLLDDMVGGVNGIGDSITKRLQHLGITTIAKLKNMTEQKVSETAAAKLGRRISLQMLKQYRGVASTS
jgi:hypothetical protein